MSCGLLCCVDWQILTSWHSIVTQKTWVHCTYFLFLRTESKLIKIQKHITEHKCQRQEKYASVWGLHTNMVDDFVLPGCDKASYPTVMEYEKKSTWNPSLDHINKWSTHRHRQGQILARQERQHMEGYSICSNVLMKAQLTITPWRKEEGNIISWSLTRSCCMYFIFVLSYTLFILWNMLQLCSIKDTLNANKFYSFL